MSEFTVEGFDGVTWVKSSASTPGTLDDSVALAKLPDGDIALADTKTGAALTFNPGELAAWIEGAKNGEFDHLI
ncbi:hypothetical protein BGM09_01020 [Streptomyces sp. CBMA29]|nr:hypothetical protein [Streptomyces sp. CBMA29]